MFLKLICRFFDVAHTNSAGTDSLSKLWGPPAQGLCLKGDASSMYNSIFLIFPYLPTACNKQDRFDAPDTSLRPVLSKQLPKSKVQGLVTCGDRSEVQ